ncbi:MAG: ABC transporter permease subunit [Holosporales bacterium]|jgi:putrescine transport system permease protein|nr:ABC transporter permease subunit [Holosporales bacterium]
MFKQFIKKLNIKRKFDNAKTKFNLEQVLIFLPYLWSIFFFVIPTILIIKISLAKSCTSLPPFLPLYENISEHFYGIYLFFGNYIKLFTDSFYFSSLLSSFILSGTSTIICFVIGYAMAYSIHRAPKHVKLVLILMIVLPFVTSFLVRVYAWMSLLNSKGIINVFLMKIGLINSPIHFLDNNYAVCLVIVYCYLPFMIMPIYATLDKIETSLVEASLDLGANNWRSFWNITFPLSIPGIMAGCTLVFVPALGEFVIPELIGGSRTLTIGQTIWSEFFNNRDWPLACAIAVLMMCSFIFYSLFSKMKSVLNKR